MIARDLERMGFTSKGEECPHCSEGNMWTGDGETVCDRCYIVFDSETRTRTKRVQLTQNRATYRRSGKKKCIGGFLGNYDWGHDGERFTY